MTPYAPLTRRSRPGESSGEEGGLPGQCRWPDLPYTDTDTIRLGCVPPRVMRHGDRPHPIPPRPLRAGLLPASPVDKRHTAMLTHADDRVFRRVRSGLRVRWQLGEESRPGHLAYRPHPVGATVEFRESALHAPVRAEPRLFLRLDVRFPTPLNASSSTSPSPAALPANSSLARELREVGCVSADDARLGSVHVGDVDEACSQLIS